MTENERKTIDSDANTSTYDIQEKATQADEEEYDIGAHRQSDKPIGVITTVAHSVKAALGAGLLGGHVAYMKAGYGIALISSVLLGLYLTFCLLMLVKSAHILYKRMQTPALSYPDLGEAAFTCSRNPKLQKRAKCFRYFIDTIIMMELFGSCACYQIIVAKSIKQLVENTPNTSINPLLPGYPNLRTYLAIMIIPFILISLIRHLQWLAPFSIVANCVIVLCIFVTIYYAATNNPKFENIKFFKGLEGYMQYTGVAAYSMSCSGAIMTIENNMKNPNKFPMAFSMGMAIIMTTAISVAFFGYVAFQEECVSPITVNFPMTIMPKILKGLIVVMIYVTHALNFWASFSLAFRYLKKLHNPAQLINWELFYRAVIVFCVSLIAIAFPNIDNLMGFLGAFCQCNMSFIFPNVIFLAVVWERPGLGFMKWRLWRGIILCLIALVLLVCGSYINGIGLFKALT